MPFRCVVKNCRGNYDTGPKVSMFSFPKTEPGRSQWLQAIKHDFKITKNSRVCEQHFREEDIIRKIKYNNPLNGQIIEEEFKIPRLKHDAIPTQLHQRSPDVRKQDVLSKSKRKAESTDEDSEEEIVNTFSSKSKGYTESRDATRVTEKHKLKVKSKDKNSFPVKNALDETFDNDECFESLAEQDAPKTFSTLDECFEMVELRNGWITVKGQLNLCFLYMPESENSVPVIKITIFMSQNLEVSVFFGDIKIKKLKCEDLRTIVFPFSVTNVHILLNICRVCEELIESENGCETIENKKQKKKLEHIQDILESIAENLPKRKKQIDFLQECVSAFAKKL